MKPPKRGYTKVSCSIVSHYHACARIATRSYSSARYSGVQRHSHAYVIVGILTGSLCGAGIASFLKSKMFGAKEEPSTKDKPQKPAQVHHHPRRITMEEVSTHNNEDTGIWMTFQDGVYDVTEYARHHPRGQDLLMLASGGRLEPLWKIFDFHKLDYVLAVLEKYRIGTLSEDEATSGDEDDWDDPYVNETPRDPALTIFQNKPFVAETPVGGLISLITPNEFFFVRNHMPVPDIAKDEYKLEISIDGEDADPVKLSLEDLKKFKKREIVATLECAGNRRLEMWGEAGASIGAGMISTARWGGALLRDVLRQAGLDEATIEDSGYQHLHLEGLDSDIIGTNYETSIPIHTAMSPQGDVLLAYEMNGEKLPRDHGFPIRCIVPGTVGARNVKWLGRITVSKEESASMWQQKAYKIIPPWVKEGSMEHSRVPAIQELPVTSLICYPKQGTSVTRNEEVTISGYAWSGGGRGIVRVDVSLDGGQTWSVAALDGVTQPPGRSWAWVLWEATLPLPEGSDKLEIISKAVDSSYNVQPDTVKPLWNYGGYVINSWHRVKVDIAD